MKKVNKKQQEIDYGALKEQSLSIPLVIANSIVEGDDRVKSFHNLLLEYDVAI